MSEHIARAVETGTAATKATITAYTSGAAATGWGFLAQVDWMQILGAVSIIGTFLVNWYYKHKHLKIEERKAEAQDRLANANIQPIGEKEEI